MGWRGQLADFFEALHVRGGVPAGHLDIASHAIIVRQQIPQGEQQFRVCSQELGIFDSRLSTFNY